MVMHVRYIYLYPCSHDLGDVPMLNYQTLPEFRLFSMPDRTECALLYTSSAFITVSTITKTILALPQAVFVDGFHNDQSSSLSGFLNATVSLARAFGAYTSHEITSKRHNGAVFPNPKAAAPFNVSYPTTSSAPVQQNPQWSPDGISTVVFGCIASILGMLAIWATLWLGQRQFNSSSMSPTLLLLLRLTPS